MIEGFSFLSCDVRGHLPLEWESELISFCKLHMKRHVIIASDKTSREAKSSERISTYVVSGQPIYDQLPWLIDFYKGRGLQLARQFHHELLQCANGKEFAINIHAAYDVDDDGIPMRYERHVDWAPTGLLYATSHEPGEGGELVVSRNPNAKGGDIEIDCAIIYPKFGQYVFLDARHFPHFVRPLVRISNNQRPFRVVAVMLYCTSPEGSCPESSRRSALDRHLGH
jgi:hypothetical protein